LRIFARRHFGCLRYLSSAEPNRSAALSRNTVAGSYTQSLLWIALFVAIAAGVALVVELVFFDLIHGNPNRSFDNVMSMITIFPPILAIIAVIAAFLVFGLPQLFQASAIGLLRRPLGDRARFAVLLALPITGVLTWYCYDYLTPSNFNLGINVPPGQAKFEHGISPVRYLGALMFQAPVTLFSFLHFELGFRGRSRWPLILIALAIMIALGATVGYDGAEGQIELQKNSPAS
jgi:hypothetical protein